MLDRLIGRWTQLPSWARTALAAAAGWTVLSAALTLDDQLVDLMPRPALGPALRWLAAAPFVGGAGGLAYGLVWSRAWARSPRLQRVVAGLAAGAAGSLVMVTVAGLVALGAMAIWLTGAGLAFGLLIAAIAPRPRRGRVPRAVA
jgi:hypothetical protein